MTAPSTQQEFRKGALIVGAGALILAPDSLMLRLMAMDQWPTAFWRGLITGTLITLVFLALRRGRYFSDVRALGWPGVAYVLCFTGASMCFVFAVRETSVASTLFLVSTSPVFAALISWRLLGERPDRRTVRTIVLALIGIGVIAFGDVNGHATRPDALWGDLAAIGAALFLAMGFNASRLARPRAMTPLMGPAGLVMAAAAGLLAGDLSVPAGSLAPMLVMAVVIVPLGGLCLTVGPRYLPAPEVSLLLLIEAVTAPLIIWWALGEYPGVTTLIGGAIVLGAIAWSSAERLNTREKPA